MPKLPILALAALLAVPVAGSARNASDAGPGGGWRLAADAPDAPQLHAASFAALAQQPVFLELRPVARSGNLLVAQPIEVAAPLQDEAPVSSVGLVPSDGISPVAATTAVPPRPIPEPNISALLLAGLAAGAWASRRRKR